MTDRLVQLGDVADMLSGVAFKSQHFLDASADGVKLVRGDNVQQGFIRWGDKAKKWRSDFFEDFQKYQLELDDVILAMDRPIVGGGLKLAWIKDQDLPSLLVQRVSRIRGLHGIALTKYLRYVLSTPNFVAYIDRITTGANIPHISGKEIARFEFTLPSLLEQERIVDLIGQYDDLIETNRRRIALLEESARLLYREWFIKLRFPGYEITNEGRNLPKGWLQKPLAELIETNPKTPYEKDKIYPFVPMQSVSESSMVIGQHEKRVISGGAKFQNFDTLLARIAPCLENGKTGFVQFLDEQLPVASGSTEFIVMRSKTVNPYWVYCLARDDSFREHAIRSMAGADGRQRVNTKCFETYMTYQAPEPILREFEALVAPAFEQVETLAKQNVALMAARDELLPKLMSGAIKV